MAYSKLFAFGELLEMRSRVATEERVEIGGGGGSTFLLKRVTTLIKAGQIDLR